MSNNQTENQKRFQENITLGIGTTAHHVTFAATTGTNTVNWQINFYDYNYQLITDRVPFVAFATTAIGSYDPDKGDLSIFCASDSTMNALLVDTGGRFVIEGVTCANGTATVQAGQGGGLTFNLSVWPKGCNKIFQSTTQVITG